MRTADRDIPITPRPDLAIEIAKAFPDLRNPMDREWIYSRSGARAERAYRVYCGCWMNRSGMLRPVADNAVPEKIVIHEFVVRRVPFRFGGKGQSSGYIYCGQCVACERIYWSILTDGPERRPFAGISTVYEGPLREGDRVELWRADQHRRGTIGFAKWSGKFIPVVMYPDGTWELAATVDKFFRRHL